MSNKLRIGLLTFPFAMALLQAVMVFGLSGTQTGVVGLTWEAVVDAFVFLPLLLVYLLVLLAPSGLPLPLKRAMTVLTVVLIAGHTIHLSANQIHNVIDREEGVPAAVLAAAYFWDELVGHWLTHIGLAGLLIVHGIGTHINQEAVRLSRLPFAIAGVVLGLMLGISALEGHSVGIYLVFCVCVTVLLIKNAIPNTYMRFYLGFAALSLLVLFTVWFGVFGSFVEPLKVLQ